MQFVFIGSMFAGTVVVAGTIGWKLRKELRVYFIPFTGFVLPLGFVVIRAISFHHVDHLLMYSISNVRINWLLELGGICILFLSSVWLVYDLKNACFLDLWKLLRFCRKQKVS